MFGDYELSNRGGCRSADGKRVKGTYNDGGYIMYSVKVTTKAERFAAHQMIAHTFHTTSYAVDRTPDHLDGQRDNNNETNLRWASKVEQTANRLLP